VFHQEEGYFRRPASGAASSKTISAITPRVLANKPQTRAVPLTFKVLTIT
jgi:hypothetical protein